MEKMSISIEQKKIVVRKDYIHLAIDFVNGKNDDYFVSPDDRENWEIVMVENEENPNEVLDKLIDRI